MLMNEIEERMSALAEGLETLNTEELEARKAEMADLAAQKETIIREAEERKALEAEVINSADTIKDFEEPKLEERKTMDRNSVEYRDNFYKFLLGKEERTIFADNTAYGDGVQIPTALEGKIWDQVNTAHPILADAETVKSGIVLKVLQATTSTIAGKKDSASASAQTQTFTEVVLAGKDFVTSVEISYAEAAMSQDALETLLAKQIADDLGTALAADCYAAVTNTVESGDTMLGTMTELLAKASTAVNPVIYCSPANYYAIMGAVDTNGQPVIHGETVLGSQIKKDTACGNNIYVIDAADMLINVIQDVTVESQKDVASAKIVIGGYLRAQGAMRKVNSAAKCAMA